MSNKFIKLLLNYVLGIVVAVWVSAIIIRQIKAQEDLPQMLQHLSGNWNSKQWILLQCIFLLAFANWSVETIKWQQLLKPVIKINFVKALRSVFTGISVSLLTPNRIGEYAGRVLYLPNEAKGQAVVANIVGSFVQLIVAATYGTLGIIVFLSYHYLNFLPWFLFATVVGLAFLLYIFFNFKRVASNIKHIKFLSRVSKFIAVANLFTRSQLVTLLLLSALRFLIFGLQFYLLLCFFFVEIPLHKALPIIYLIFWTMTVLPSIAIAEAPVRTKMSTWLLGFFTLNTFGITAASLSLWLINIILPSIIGALSIVGLKLAEQLETD
jgi:hypothetical protein